MTQKDTSSQHPNNNIAQAILHDLGRASLDKDGTLNGKTAVEVRRAGLKEVAKDIGLVVVGISVVVGGKLLIDHQESKYAGSEYDAASQIDGQKSGNLDHVLDKSPIQADSLTAGLQPEAIDNSVTYVVPKAT